MADSGKVVLGLLAGVAIGATLGILLAPDKGTETRRKLTEKAEDLGFDLEDKFDDFMRDMKKKYAGVKDQVEDTVAEQKENAEEAAKGVVPA